MNNIELLDKNNCTGCLACYNICPFHAITLKKNYDGFIEPVVDGNTCVECGKCVEICAQLSNDIKFNLVKKTFAIICDDVIRDNCSSGGYWGIASRKVCENGGIVYGAVFNEGYKEVIHQRIVNMEEVCKTYGSKYLQSNMNKTYVQVKEDLENGKKVLFSGCPCQVDALNRYLVREYQCLITIDILCHGVVSPWVYEQFIKEFFGDVDSPICKVGFRDKKFGWAQNVVVAAQDGTERISSRSGSYFNAFLWGYSQRKACFSCKYATENRVGDITVGDFWGIQNICPNWEDKRGTSLVLANTEKGKNLVIETTNCIKKIEEFDYLDVIEKTGDINWALVKPSIIPKTRDALFYRLHRGDSFSTAFKYASTGNYDVGIFGWWFEDAWANYGSVLSYYALMEYVSSLGLSVCMIISPFHKFENASEFVKKHGYVISPTYNFNEYWRHNERIKTFLLGSDQLWFYNCYKGWGHALFLDFVEESKKKVSYATSFGHKEPQIPDSERKELQRLFKRFDGLSVREFDGVDYLKNNYGVQAQQNIDPVFLLDKKLWEEMAENAERKVFGQFIFSYILDPSDEKVQELKYLSRKFKMPMVTITDRQYKRTEKEELLVDCGVIRNATIYELIYHLKNATYVITDSYHGTCFSLIFQRNFATIINPTRGVSRFETLITLFDIGKRFVTDAKSIIEKDELIKRPNYYEIQKLIDRSIRRSKAWLDNQLLNDK